MNQRDFISIHTIVCPECRMKQTGIVRESPGVVIMLGGSIPSSKWRHIPFGTHYIRCSYIPCEYIIMNDELAEVTAQRVQFPNQINK